MRSKQMQWILEDHLCRSCGGRILRCVSGGGPTGGGNPIWRCADCGKSEASMSPDGLCWCGFSHRQNSGLSPYVCVPFSILEEKPQLLEAFRSCGCDPANGGEVGIMLEKDLAAARH